MDSEVIVERWTPPPRHLVPMTFRRGYRLSDGRSDVQVSRGETLGVPPDQIAFLLRQQIAVVPGTPLDPPPPDVTPTAIRLLRAWQTARGQWFGSNERVTLPKHETDTLIATHGARLDDGHEDVAPDSPATRRRSRILAHGRQQANRVLERFR